MTEQYKVTNSSVIQYEETQKVGYVALSICLYFLFMPFDLVSLGGIGTILRLLAMVPIVAIALNYDKCTFNSREALFIILYAIYKQFSVIYTVFPTFTLEEAPRIAANLTLVLIIGSLYYLNSKELYLLKLSLAISSVMTIVMLFLFADYSGGGRLTIRTSSGEVDQNYLIGYLLFIIPFAIERIISKKRLLSLFPVIAVFVLIFMTGSRGGLLSAIAVTAIAGYGELKTAGIGLRKALMPLLCLIGVAVLALLYSFQFLNPQVLERFSLNYVEANGTSGRKDIWIYFIKLYLQSTPMRELFGYGTGVSAFMNRMNTRMAGHVAHNLWIDELITGGAIGLVLLLIIHCTFMITAIKCRDAFTASTFFGFLLMCANLSIISYKPMWNCMIMIMLVNKNRKVQLRRKVNNDEDLVQT